MSKKKQRKKQEEPDIKTKKITRTVESVWAVPGWVAGAHDCRICGKVIDTNDFAYALYVLSFGLCFAHVDCYDKALLENMREFRQGSPNQNKIVTATWLCKDPAEAERLKRSLKKLARCEVHFND